MIRPVFLALTLASGVLLANGASAQDRCPPGTEWVRDERSQAGNVVTITPICQQIPGQQNPSPTVDPSASPVTPAFEIDKNVRMTDELMAKLGLVASDFQARTGIRFVVTSSYRNNFKQAAVMLKAFNDGLDPNSYVQKQAASELKQIVDDGNSMGRDQQEIIWDMAAKIDADQRQGIRLSWHPEGDAVDIRIIKSVTPEQLHLLDGLMWKQGLERIREKGGDPHYHYQPIRKGR
ncbi:MAG: hypothetical protein ABSD74_06100 [Rhizomicrobium sp.]